MIQINIYVISKNIDSDYKNIIDNLIKSSLKFAKIRFNNIWNKDIAKAQNISSTKAQESYTKAFLPYLKNNDYNIVLHPTNHSMDSYQFAKILQDKLIINFFIGGAFGFEKRFLDLCDKQISLSSLTLSHKIAYLVLTEQIFRGLSINNNYPYHK